MKKKELKFEINQLVDLTLGRLEGEQDSIKRDGSLNNDTFIQTDSVKKYLKKYHSYVLSNKGAGKSALFMALKNQIFDKEIVNWDEYEFLFIDDSFGIDDEFLNPISGSSNDKYAYTITWAFYLIHKIITNIIENHPSSESKKRFQEKIRNVSNFKDKYELYKVIDYINQFKLKLQLKIQGQKISLDPTIKTKEKKKNLNLNELILFVNNYYKSIDKQFVFLIDRVDNFVTKEVYEVQKNYIQGLITFIEEVSRFENVRATLFLRTDLFNSLSLELEYDKAKDRILYLRWSHSEILQFVVKRLFYNQYIKKEFDEYFRECYFETYLENTVKSFFEKIYKKYKLKTISDFDLTQDYAGSVIKNFLLLFFPKTIHHKKYSTSGELEEIDFFKWFFTHFKDNNEYINPRTIIHFFNLLFEEQYLEYQNNPDCLHFKEMKDAIKIGNYYTFPVFTSKSINKVYYVTQNDELKNIYTILKRTDKTIFRIINEASYKKGTFHYNDIKLPKNYSDHKFERLLKYLSLLGYLSIEKFKVEKARYNIPILYQKVVNFDRNY